MTSKAEPTTTHMQIMRIPRLVIHNNDKPSEHINEWYPAWEHSVFQGRRIECRTSSPEPNLYLLLEGFGKKCRVNACMARGIEKGRGLIPLGHPHCLPCTLNLLT